MASSATGKPKRKCAGRPSLQPGFVLTADAVDPDSSDDGVVEDDDDGTTIKTKRQKRRRASPAPPAVPAAPPKPIPVPKYSDANLGRFALVEDSSKPPPTHVSMTFHVPPGHSGPFVVNFDFASLTEKASLGIADPSRFDIVASAAPGKSKANIKAKPGKARGSAGSRPGKKSKQSLGDQAPAHATGFLDLSGELRNVIYRLALTPCETYGHCEAVNFLPHRGRKFSRAGALLATCRQVHIEAAQILYGENKFVFGPSNERRGEYWEQLPQAIGWQDVHRFLATIGPQNLSYLRSVAIIAEDCRDAAKPRFKDDDHFMASLKLLAQHGKLDQLRLGLFGKTAVSLRDDRLLDNLFAVKADGLCFVSNNHFGNPFCPTPSACSLMMAYYRGSRYGKAARGVDAALVKHIVRNDQDKLYASRKLDWHDMMDYDSSGPSSP